MNKLFFILSLFFSVARARGQSATDIELMSFYKEIISVLANDSMQGRSVSSIFEKKTADEIYNRMKLNGCHPKVQKFHFTGNDSVHTSVSMNVYCRIDNHAIQTIIIGAHYDHIGLGGKLSRSLMKKDIHNGADDNASGVALMLGLLKNYSLWKNNRFNYYFVAYSAHEIGLFGSEAFSNFILKNKNINLRLVLNFDMVGRMDDSNRIVKISGAQSNKFKDIFFNQQISDSLNLRFTSDSLLYELDTRAFYMSGFNALSFTTGVHDDYHKTTDDEEKINYRGILRIQKFIERFLYTMN